MKFTQLKTLLLAAFCLSGATSLIYEIVWERQLELLFGTTVYAVSAILSVYFGGLGLGSFLGGRIIDQYGKKNENADTARFLLRFYAAAEIAIGCYALATPKIFALIGDLQIFITQQQSVSFGYMTLIRFVLLFFALIIPTALMGTTLPVLSKFFAERQEDFGSCFGKLYAANTLGGVLGAVTVGFVFISRFGLLFTLYIAAAMNLLVGILVLIQSKDITEIEARRDGQRPQQKSGGGLLDVNHRVILFVFFMSGLGALALEVLWTRVYVMVIGNSVYAFSTILAVFLAGIVAGSFLGARFSDRSKNLIRHFILIETGIGLCVFLTTVIIPELPYYFLKIFEISKGDFAVTAFLNFALVAAVLFIPAALMGMAFPAAVKIYLRRINDAGGCVGEVYGANTIGSVFGPLAASFLLIPVMGIQKSILAVGVLYSAMGVLLITAHSRAPGLKHLRPVSFLISGILFASVFLMPAWEPSVVGSGVYINQNSYLNLEDKSAVKAAMLAVPTVFYEEGISANIAVKRHEENNGKLTTSLFINGKADAGTGADFTTEILSGSLPLLIHPDPQEVLVVGFGSGITVDSVLSHPVGHVDVVEIEPAVVKAAEFFRPENNRALHDPRIHIVYDDARHFVRTQKKSYDVITAEPSNPWISGVSGLFTKEQFEYYRARLKDDGIMLQWAHCYGMTADSLRTIVATFQDVFPHTLIWQSYVANDIFLLGSKKPFNPDFALFKNRMAQPSIKANWHRADIDSPYKILSWFVTDGQGAEDFSSKAPLHTDNHPILEFNAPKAIYKDTVPENTKLLMEIRRQPQNVFKNITPGDEQVLSRFQRGLYYCLLADIAMRGKDFNVVLSLLDKSIAANPDDRQIKKVSAQINYAFGAAYIQVRALDPAVTYLTKTVELDPRHAGAHQQLGRIFTIRGDYNQAYLRLKEAQRLNPRDSETVKYLDLLKKSKGAADLP